MKELSKKSKAELMKELDSKYVSLREIRFGNSAKSKNVMEGRAIKKDIARIQTLIKNAQ